ncbi:SDR family oxidoreductase [Actinomycetospora sp. OC33-EN08]|uniref:SDR family oxidoreductase n=1 Tax=Actinomycetospora aurantiaca TaxID=3129233 RepID=A0ABU8MMP1_9PSEU
MSNWLITGAGRGLGAEIARAAAAAGHHVAVGARRVASLPEDLRGHERTVAVTIDVTDEASVRDAVQQVVGELGGIDVLVNNAGRGLLGALEEISDAEARSLFDVNVFGLISVTRAVLPTMRAQGRGTIVNIGSRAGFEGEPGAALYAASKFAVAGISEALAAEMEPFGVRAMVVEPGVFRTDFLDASSLATPASRVDAYDGTPAHATLDWADDANHTQLGDPVRGAALIVEVVDTDKLPTHLLLGRDAYERHEVVTARRADDLALWRERSLATAHED